MSYNTGKNNHFRNSKNSTIYTPDKLSKFLYGIVSQSPTFNSEDPGNLTVYDPCIGRGSLTNPYFEAGWNVIGTDVVERYEYLNCNDYRQEDFTQLSEQWGNPPNLVVCNPPFNHSGEKRGMLLPEQFIRKVDFLFGSTTPLVLIAPMGVRLNQSKASQRFRYLRDNWSITSIVSLPINIFKKANGEQVKFHTEVLLFNISGLNPHYFLSENVLS